MKKTIALLLSVIMIFGLMPTSFASNSLTVSADSVFASQGDEVTVNINVTDNPGIIALSLKIGYDSRLTLKSVSNGNVMTGDNVMCEFSPDYTKNPYSAVWISSSTQNITATGTLLTMTFDVSPNADFGDALITVECDSAYDVNLTPVTPSTTDGKVTITRFYTVTFKDYDGRIIETQQVAEGESATTPTAPTREGYTFTGWDIDFTNVTSDLTVTAQYTVNLYKLSYYVDTELYYTAFVEYGDVITPLDEPTMEGHTFSGWSEIPATMPAHDVEIYGTFSPNRYSILYYVDGAYYDSQSYNYGETIVPLDAPTMTGYTFSGWSEIPATMPAENLIVTGTFTANTYKIFYYVDGDYYGEQQYAFGATITPLDAPTMTGYTFSGWENLPATMPARDIDVMGSFSVNTYKIFYYVDGDYYGEQQYTFGATITPLDAPTMTGYTFSGWENLPATMPARDIDVMGSFSVNTYKIFYYVDGDYYGEQQYAFGATITPLDAPTMTGYTFSGWENLPATMPARDIDVMGSFSVNSYTLTYFVDGELYDIYSIQFGAVITPIEEPTREGHIFSGWSEIPATMPAHDVDVYGTFTVNEYTISYYIDGELFTTQTCEVGSTIPYVEAPDKEGYTFAGWMGLPSVMPAHDVEVQGIYSINIYIIAYFIDGNEEPYAQEEYEYGEAITPIEEPTREGYHFTGWSAIPETMPAHNVRVTGAFLPNRYTVTFVDWDGNVISAQHVYHGESATAPTAPAREGYTFIGWDVDFTNVTSDLTVTAQYKINKYTLTFVDGLTGEVIATIEVEHGGNAEFPEAPVHDGYEFIGWDNDGLHVTSDLTITAQYKSSRIPYDVNNDGRVNTGDAVAILRALAGLDELDEESIIVADTNADGAVNTGDAVFILRWLAGLIDD